MSMVFSSVRNLPHRVLSSTYSLNLFNISFFDIIMINKTFDHEIIVVLFASWNLNFEK